eukprot:TRINITY_DN52_c0_g3_i1.p1 TRINITY_DN52_c0_g3~~TRINITY_DN52_c0_g3_i1.p1  ORF type:complete len:280 (+),score=71.93 TRINITY_DN52_c0_g3_i1:322-1161(+)
MDSLLPFMSNVPPATLGSALQEIQRLKGMLKGVLEEKEKLKVVYREALEREREKADEKEWGFRKEVEGLYVEFAVKKAEWVKELEMVSSRAEEVVAEKQLAFKKKILDAHVEQENIYLAFRQETSVKMQQLAAENESLHTRINNLVTASEEPHKIQAAMLDAAKRAQSALQEKHESEIEVLRRSHADRLKSVQEHSMEVMKQISQEAESQVASMRLSLESEISSLTEDTAMLRSALLAREDSISQARDLLMTNPPPPGHEEVFVHVLMHLNAALGHEVP